MYIKNEGRAVDEMTYSGLALGLGLRFPLQKIRTTIIKKHPKFYDKNWFSKKILGNLNLG